MTDCAECGLPVDRDEAHMVHEHDCTERVCTCDLYVHAGCCTACKPIEVPGQLTIEVA